jgi:tRNA-modifying protein YgfZ
MRLLDEPAVRRREAGFVRVSGHDRLSYLHTLLSQDVESLEPGDVADFLYLDAKGNAQAVGRAVAFAGAVVLVVPADVAAWLAERLASYTFLMDASAEVVEGWALASARGPDPVAAAGARDEPMSGAPHGDGMVVRDRTGGIDWVGPADWVDRAVADSGLPQATGDEWEAWRILAGVPAWRSEIGASRRTQELGLLPTHVHLRKGCYPGQESIAKTYNLGRPRRALCVVRFDGLVKAGDEVVAGERQGQVTSAAEVDDGSVALAMLPVDREGTVAGDGKVAAGDVTGTVLRRVGEGLPLRGA